MLIKDSWFTTKPRFQSEMQNYISEFQTNVNQKNSHMRYVKVRTRWKIISTGARFGGESLNSNVSIHKAYFQLNGKHHPSNCNKKTHFPAAIVFFFHYHSPTETQNNYFFYIKHLIVGT